MQRTIINTATGEKATFVETSRETTGARTVAEVEVQPGGGVPLHQHSENDETIEVLAGEIEVTMDGHKRRLGPGESVSIARGTTHRWCNASADRALRFRGTLTPGHPGFERFLCVYYGLGRDGELGSNKLPKRFADLALLGDLDPSIYVGIKRILRPLMRWAAARARKRGREAELLQRYVQEPSAP